MRSPDTLTSPATRHRIPPQWWPWCSTVARLVLAGVWAWAGVAKVGDPDASVRAVRAYEILPEAFVKPFAWGLPFVELGHHGYAHRAGGRQDDQQLGGSRS